VVTYGGGLARDMGVRVGYDGMRVSELSGYFEDPSSDLRADVLRVARAYDGYMETARTIERYVDVSTVPGAGAFEPWRVDTTVLDGFGQAEAKIWHLASRSIARNLRRRPRRSLVGDLGGRTPAHAPCLLASYALSTG